MPPNPLDTATPRTEPISGNIAGVNSTKHHESRQNYKIGPFEFRTALKWPNIVGYTLLHIGAVYALFTFSFFNYKMLTLWGESTINNRIFIIFFIFIFMIYPLLVLVFRSQCVFPFFSTITFHISSLFKLSSLHSGKRNTLCRRCFYFY